MRFVSTALVTLMIVTLAIPRVAAQQPHVVDQAAMQKAFDQQAADTHVKRQAIRTALQQADVVQIANRLGLEVARAEAAVATLEGAELNQLAAQAEAVNDSLAGGQTIRMNAVWIIIGLLVLILVIVAVD